MKNNDIDIHTKLIVSIVISLIGICGYGQNSIIGDDYKKELWKTIKPTNESKFELPGSSLKSSKEIINENKYIRSYHNYKNNLDNLIEITKPKYTINPGIFTYKGSTPLNQLPRGSTQLVFMGGHFYFVPTGGLLVVPSGFDFSGGGRKKLSEKSKSILQNVYGMEIDE
ncbi:MAG: hypothetical protein ACLVKO_10150 [Dysgonomonas sp.]